MLFDLIQMLLAPDEYVCCWRDGELFIECVEAPVETLEKDLQVAEETTERRAA